MQRTSHTLLNNLQNRPWQRIAALTGLVLTGLTGLVGTASAQSGPLAPAPEYPTPYHSPVFHSGGASTPYPLAGVDPLIDPLFDQLQGTPTGYFPQPPGAGAVPTQIPSFLLGDYVPGTPPGAAGVYYPNHFADGNIYSWAAPFAYVPLNSGGFTLDDNGQISPTTAGAGSVFAITNGPWNQVTTGNEAGTATNGEYYRLGPGSPPVGTVYGVKWTLTASTAGSYSVFFHIPDNIDDGSGNIETRNPNVTYLIAVTTATGVLNTAATVSQTEANSSQFLTGPYQLGVGDTVVVTLERTAGTATTPAINNLSDGNAPPAFGQYDLIADSMTLQAATGDVQSTPTAINRTAYPTEFAAVKYWGIKPNIGTAASTTGVLATDLTVNAGPDTVDGTPTGVPILKSGSPAAASASDAAETTSPNTPGNHLIRQLVYFGRSEPTFTNQYRRDDSDAAGFTPGAFTTVVAAPDAINATNNNYHRATAVNSPTAPTPAVWSLTPTVGGNYFVTIHLPNPTTTPTIETRTQSAQYTITVGATTYTPPLVDQTTTFGDYVLPTGPIPVLAGQTITISLSNVTNDTPLIGQVVVADSVTIKTATGAGAIYCVDGFTGAVVWRFETPSAATGASAPIFSSPAVARINVLTSTNPVTYANKLVVVVGDNNGLVYCLDAIGNGDGTSNANAIDPTTGQPIYSPQPLYGDVAPVQVGAAGYTAHVGTTGVYWIYRPDANQPKNIATGLPRTDNRGNALFVPASDLPTPAAFGAASPTIFVDPTKTIAPAAATDSNATVYVGNSNGVLYALDAIGAAIDGTSHSVRPNPGSNLPAYTVGTFESTGDRFNVSQDIGGAATGFAIPSCQPKWWFTLRGPGPNDSTNTSSADIESAPAVYVDTTTTPGSYLPHVYIGSAHEQESTSNVGRLYALNGLLGPSGNNGRSAAMALPAGALPANYTGPGSANYNIGQKPQTNNNDTTDWSFPSALDSTTGPAASNPTFGWQNQSSNGKARPALGNVTGSPVVFTNIHETANAGALKTRIYFAANVGIEIPAGSAAGAAASVRPDDTQTGRIWAVNLDGSVGTTTNSGAAAANGSNVWSYPLANDPNDQTKDTVAEPLAPIGSFLHVTPAIGFVQFPTTIVYGPTGTTAYTHPDAVVGDVKGQSVPMLYAATRGVNDTALYAIDIDGTQVPGPVTFTTPATPPTPTTDTQTIYRQISPDGSIFQSSPVLITNATATTPGGNGGTVLLTAGNTLYDFSATPISNPITTQNYPLIREDRAYTGFGPISGPALAAADVTDLQGYGLGSQLPGTVNTGTQNVTDWVYVGDRDTGLCRGITPNDLSDASIPIQLGGIVSPTPTPPGTVLLSSVIQTYLVSDANYGSTKATDADPVGPTAALPVYEWGQNVYIRFKNVVPPNPNNSPALYVHDNAAALNPGDTVYGNGGQIDFDLSDVDDSATDNGNPAPVVDHGVVHTIPVPVTPPDPTRPLPEGFYQRTDTITALNPADPTSNLTDNNGSGYIAAYTYAISDGTARRNTPGGRRHVINAHQTVFAYTYNGGLITDPTSYSAATPTTVVLSATATNGNEVTVQTGAVNGIPTYGLRAVAPVDQPTFGILNPLGLRAAGIPLLATDGVAQQIGDELGPFRPVSTAATTGTITSTGSAAQTSAVGRDLESLTNGNSVYIGHAPPSTSGLGDPTKPAPIGGAGSIIPPSNPYTVVTSTPLISHNHSGDNSDLNPTVTAQITGNGFAGNGLGAGTPFAYSGAPYAANVFDRTPLGFLGNRMVNTKMNVPRNTDNTNGTDGLYWNDNLASVDGHNAVVNYLPWETAPGSYKLGSANSSPDYPDISPQNVNATLHSSSSGDTDLQAASAALAPASGNPNSLSDRTVYASSLQIHIAVPHYQPASQQVYAAGLDPNATGYSTNNAVPPLDSTGASNIKKVTNAFPMGYVTNRRIYVPSRNGRYQTGAAYRDISIYTGVPVDMSTSIANPTTDIGNIPAAFGVQTQQFVGDTTPFTPVPNLSFFTPNNPAFQDYFKPLEIHNDGNVNLLNVHLDQRQNFGTQVTDETTLLLYSDANDPLSLIDGYDRFGMTGQLTTLYGPRTTTLPPNAAGTSVPEQPFLIRSSVDTDLMLAYGRNPGLLTVLGQNGNPLYLGGTFHKPTPGGDAPSILTVPDSPSDTSSQYYLPASATGLPVAGQTVTTPPLVSLAVPFGTPVGTYSTTAPQDGASLRLFEGLDLPTPNNLYAYSVNNILYPPQYGNGIGGINGPTAGLNDIYTKAEPLSTTGTQLSATVVASRMTDGATAGAVPMIDATTANPGVAGGAQGKAFPDFAPAAFRDPTSQNLSVYWTSGRSGTGYGIYGANVPFSPATTANPLGYFTPSDPTKFWWTSIGGYSSPNVLQPVANLAPGTNSGLTIAQDYADPANVFAFAVNVANGTVYNNTLYSYDVAPGTGVLSTNPLPMPITDDPSQVKYGVKGLYNSAGFTVAAAPKLWAFWTASTRGRTTIGYNSLGTNNTWLPATGTTVGLLPIPAGLTSIADPSPLLMTAPVVNPDGTLPGNSQSVLEVTYSGTGPDGNVDLYMSRYVPDTTTVSKLDLTAYPQMTEILKQGTGSGWYQARDVGWSRTGALNVFVADSVTGVASTRILYSTANTPLFAKATFDKASGLLVLTGISGTITDSAGKAVFSNVPVNGKITVFVDAATGRVRFTGGIPARQVQATFNPQAKRLTVDSRADTAPITFLDDNLKPNDTTGLANVQASRRWTIWRKSGVGGDPTSASLYYKTQRLTLFLPGPLAVTAVTSVKIGATDVTAQVDIDYARRRIFFPISTGAEGQMATVSYTNASGSQTTNDTVQWQDEETVNDTTNIPSSTLDGLAAVNPGYGVPIDTAVNENNVAAFLDPFASATSEHKIWLFWNSTRNGTADIYSETINPRF